MCVSLAGDRGKQCGAWAGDAGERGGDLLHSSHGSERDRSRAGGVSGAAVYDDCDGAGGGAEWRGPADQLAVQCAGSAGVEVCCECDFERRVDGGRDGVLGCRCMVQ